MRKNLFLMMAACGGALFSVSQANAQEAVVVEESMSIAEVPECKDVYFSTNRDNWFIQIGAGIQSPFVENWLVQGDKKHHITMLYNVGFGKWMSPYLGWRLGFNYGAIHFDAGAPSKARVASANFDLMWDMFNSFGGVNTERVFSIVPFVGLGGNYTYDMVSPGLNISREDNVPHIKKTSWTLPVSAGLQLRFRLCDYVNFFAEGRAVFAGDNYNGIAEGNPVDMNFSVIGGFAFKIGGDSFRSYNPCNDLAYIEGLNSQVNDLRGQLAATAAELAAAKAQLPCPPTEVVSEEADINIAPVLTTVRFTLNSARISDQEMVNVYNIAQYLKDNPEVNVTICGYADKDTGTAAYNMQLSERRAKAVADCLTNTYGIDASRLVIDPQGSETQPYDKNAWNRIVIFVPGV